MDTSTDIANRLTELEIKLTFTEDLVDELNRVLAGQQQQMALVMAEIRRLREDVQSAHSAPGRPLSDDLPPHY